MAQVTVRGRDAIRQWDLSDWHVWVGLSALSAEPETVEEWYDAVRRYRPNHTLAENAIPLQAIPFNLLATDWCLIDLVGRTVVAGEDFELPERRGAYQADEHDPQDGFPIIWLDTPDDWVWRQAGPDWESELRAGRPPVCSEPGFAPGLSCSADRLSSFWRRKFSRRTRAARCPKTLGTTRRATSTHVG